METQQTITEQERNTLVEELNAIKNKGMKTVWIGIFILMIGLIATIISISAGAGYLWYGAILWGLGLLIVGLIQQNKASKQLRELDGMDQKQSQQTTAVKTCPVVEQVNPEIYDFRHVKDVANIIRYDTLSEPLNHLFYSYLNQNLTDCKVIAKVAAGSVFPGAPEYAMPINFLITKGDKQVAILLVHKEKTKRYSLLETKELCKENGVTSLCFYFEYENTEDYVVERVSKLLV